MTFHEDVFYECFRPYRHPEAKFDVWGGLGLETFGDDLQLVSSQDPNHVWTVVDGEKDEWIVPGYHRVNRICYLLTDAAHFEGPFEFRINSRARALTSMGLARRVATLRRILSELTVKNNTNG